MSQPTRTSHLSDADLVRFRRKLEALRAALVAEQLASLHEQQVTDREVSDSVDLAERTLAQELALGRATFDARWLAEIDHALEKLDAGTYGISEVSGEPIELDRLEAVPWARRTAAEEDHHEIVELAELRHARA